MKRYTYKVIRENVVTGERSKRSRMIERYKPLTVGGLYMHLGSGYPDAQRVLELVRVEEGEE